MAVTDPETPRALCSRSTMGMCYPLSLTPPSQQDPGPVPASDPALGSPGRGSLTHDVAELQFPPHHELRAPKLSLSTQTRTCGL